MGYFNWPACIGFDIDHQCGACSFYFKAATVAKAGFKPNARLPHACSIDCDEVVLENTEADGCNN